MGSVTSINDFMAHLLMHETEAVYETMTLLFCKLGVKGVHIALMCKGSSLYCLTQSLFDCTAKSVTIKLTIKWHMYMFQCSIGF